MGRNISGGCDILMKNAQGKKKELTLAPGEMDISFFFFLVCDCVCGGYIIHNISCQHEFLTL